MADTLIQHFDQLVSKLYFLENLLKTKSHRFWGSEQCSTLRQAGNALVDYWYLDGRDGRITNSYYAAIMVSDATLEKIQEINALKLKLKQLFTEIRKTGNDQLENIRGDLAIRHPVLARKLATQGLARLHLKQLTRVIPVLEITPQKLSFDWYQSGRSIQKVTKKEALDRLMKLDQSQANFQIQYQTLAQIRNTSPLAIVQELAPIMRLNVLYETGERSAQNIALPLFFPASDKFPEIKAPTEHPPEKRIRKRRSDNRIEDEPLLSGLRIYKYRDFKY